MKLPVWHDFAKRKQNLTTSMQQRLYATSRWCLPTSSDFQVVRIQSEWEVRGLSKSPKGTGPAVQVGQPLLLLSQQGSEHPGSSQQCNVVTRWSNGTHPSLQGFLLGKQTFLAIRCGPTDGNAAIPYIN